MKTDTAQITAFPDVHRATEAKPRRRQPLRQLAAQSEQLPMLEKGGSANGHSKTIVARPGPRQLSEEEHADHVAKVVRIAIRSAKRRGVRLESVLSIPRRWLLDLCDEGDPTCVIVRDWLLGNRKHLPKDLEGTATGWTSGKWGDA
ncbi:hypothetical protein IMCC20628_04885 (plasmid) [Hoeflea sp. IMCC20628]|uniref:hypothetical protein n=1 Tax=Hoeflea sp. IMCC20628 TaxID=1620421 RepID=UPI00063AD1C3|nr:hypothetical protein [Hoeflea sp. IMCC20628]AKI03549.1 hypothetical protein IMCC20628_04885 [Hoeflea sp. IMCC20628]